MFTLTNKYIFNNFIPKITCVSVEYTQVFGYAKNCRTLQLRLRRTKNGITTKIRGNYYRMEHDPSIPTGRDWVGRIYTFDPPIRASSITIGTEGKWCAHPHIKVGIGLTESDHSDLCTFLYWIIDKK